MDRSCVSCRIRPCTIALLAAALALGPGCSRDRQPNDRSSVRGQPASASTARLGAGQPGDSAEEFVQSGAGPEQDTDLDAAYAMQRRAMVRHQIKARGVADPRILEVMERVPRHEFVPEALRDQAHEDHPLPIGHGQTISQPYIVALMTELVQPGPGDRALDIGTGSGYQAAVLAELTAKVFGIEILPELAEGAAGRLQRLGYGNVRVIAGDGYRGWPEYAPFDCIIVAAAPDHVPMPLVEQLAPGGRMVIPVGDHFQQLVVVEKAEDGSVTERRVIPVRFVPMTGEARDH